MCIETEKVMVYVCMAQVTEGAGQKGVEGVDTLQAAEPPCSVSNGSTLSREDKFENLGKRRTNL